MLSDSTFGRISTGLFLACFICFPVFAEEQSERTSAPAQCRHIKTETERLRCYDKIAELESMETESAGTPEGNAAEKEAEVSYFSRIWELDEKTQREKYTFRIHRPTYVLPFTYNGSPNVEPLREADPTKELKKPEVTFQMSFKVKLLQNIFGKNVDLWFGYTQRSFWQLYNFADSSPFRETNYEPELLLNFKTNYEILGLKLLFINFGLNHQSNGQTDPLSRSWNRAVLNLGFEREPVSILLKTWCRFPESAEEDDNPGITRYLGYGEIWAYYFYKKHRFGLMIRDSLRFEKNRGALQAEWSFPLFFKNVAGHVQYFNGYGESLLDYDHRTNRIGVGFIVVDWY